MAVWTYCGHGIRYKEHETRKHGPKPDRFWCLKYKLNGQEITETVGWWSRGITQARCMEIMTELRRNQRTGRGPRTWKEMKLAEQQAAAPEEAEITVAEFWKKEYSQRLKLTAQPTAIQKGDYSLRTWLAPLADRPLISVTTTDLEKLVVRPMVEAGKSPSYIASILGFFSALWSARPGNMIWSRGKTPGRRPNVPRWMTSATVF